MAARAVLGDQVLELADNVPLPVDSRRIIKKLLSERPVSPESVDRDLAARWFEATNLFMQQISLN